jgi:hypothetical protein
MNKELSMKKIAGFLVIFAAVGGLFAQELKFDGYLNSGLGFVVTDQQTEDPDDSSKSKAVDPYLTAYGADAGAPGYRFRLNGAYTNADSNVGARFRFQSQSATLVTPDTDLGLSFAIPYAYGWVKLLDGVIRRRIHTQEPAYAGEPLGRF